VVVLYSLDHNGLGLPLSVELKDEPPLVIQPQRPLMVPVTFQLLDSQGPQRVEISLIRGCSDELHDLSERLARSSSSSNRPSIAGRIGGRLPHPGEASLAHLGVLFLDELPEFSQRVLEALRQPLEDGSVMISRAAGSAAFPARFQMIGAANPCRRGCASLEACVCTADEKRQYLARLSRPLMTGSTCISRTGPALRRDCGRQDRRGRETSSQAPTPLPFRCHFIWRFGGILRFSGVSDL
jgi:hypothetical protein